MGEVYRKFNISGQARGKLEKLKSWLVSKSHKTTEPTKNRQDWGSAPDVSVFYGRQQELKELKQWILDDNCRLIALSGMHGIGKTALAVELAKKIQSSFDCVYWRSLEYLI